MLRLFLSASYSGLSLARHWFFLSILQEIELNGCARALVRLSPQAPAVPLDDGTADGQPHTHALWLGCVESVKDLFQAVRIDAGARVSHCDQDFLRPVLT